MDKELKFIKRIDTEKHSIFYSLILNNNNNIIGYGRKYYSPHERIIKKIILDNNFNIIQDNVELIRGEDPRVFNHNNIIYVVDNNFNDTHLYNTLQKTYIKINLDGKNFSFISHNSNLYLIHYMKPLCLYKVNLDNGNVEKINSVYDGINNGEYRGGTPGYKISDNRYYGFGHKTYVYNNILKHDIFLWILDFTTYPMINIIDIKKPINSNNIMDPTSIITLNNKNYLISAESEFSWFRDQDYITNVYEICFDLSTIEFNYLIPFDLNIPSYKVLNKDLSYMSHDDAIKHYIEYGKNENRKYKLNLPDNFDTSIYKLLNKDLSHMSDEDALKHYIEYGKKEKRKY